MILIFIFCITEVKSITFIINVTSIWKTFVLKLVIILIFSENISNYMREREREREREKIFIYLFIFWDEIEYLYIVVCQYLCNVRVVYLLLSPKEDYIFSSVFFYTMWHFFRMKLWVRESLMQSWWWAIYM